MPLCGEHREQVKRLIKIQRVAKMARNAYNRNPSPHLPYAKRGDGWIARLNDEILSRTCHLGSLSHSFNNKCRWCELVHHFGDNRQFSFERLSSSIAEHPPNGRDVVGANPASGSSIQGCMSK